MEAGEDDAICNLGQLSVCFVSGQSLEELAQPLLDHYRFVEILGCYR